MEFPSAVRGSDLPARILILGLDGATWDVIDAMGDQLPNLSRLRREGAWGPLQSTTPAMTLPAWSSILTGCNPGIHGILDFTRRPPGSYQVEFLNSTCRRVPTIHRILSDQGGRVASFAVPGTFPPEPLNGVALSGFDSPIAT
ncbi:MAG TPA: alkaline phosphatase family protein, partial [Myxococcota bacterium]|nr:alkaline phosphatase family protein [Myxococcota bacterium]